MGGGKWNVIMALKRNTTKGECKTRREGTHSSLVWWMVSSILVSSFLCFVLLCLLAFAFVVVALVAVDFGHVRIYISKYMKEKRRLCLVDGVTFIGWLMAG